MLDGLIYAIGGMGRSEVEMYDPSTDRWAAVEPLPAARYGRAAVTIGEVIYVVGGRVGGRASDSVLRFDPRDGRWQPATSMQSEREDLSAVAI